MGTYNTKEEAENRLRQVEYFKHKNEDIEFRDNKNPEGTPIGSYGLMEGEDMQERDPVATSKLMDRLISSHWPCKEEDLDSIWDDIVEKYDDPELAEDVCSALEEKISNSTNSSIQGNKKLYEEINDENLVDHLNDNCINEYRRLAGLEDGDLLTEDTFDEWAATAVSANHNYDYEDFKNLLLKKGK